MKTGFLQKGDLLLFSEKIIYGMVGYNPQETTTTIMIADKKEIGTGDAGICRLDLFVPGFSEKKLSFYFSNGDNFLTSFCYYDATNKLVNLEVLNVPYNVTVVRGKTKFEFFSGKQFGEYNRSDYHDYDYDYDYPSIEEIIAQEIEEEIDKKIVLDEVRRRATRAWVHGVNGERSGE